jgi:hypothetical protein
MMEHYVTLFDSLFLPQGLALHMSMERHVNNYILWIICVDDQVHEDLSKLNLANVNLLRLSKLETAELLTVKPTRTKAEYCWTLTPFAPRFVFEADSTAHRVTYIDADVWFRKNPAPIFREFDASGKQVLITDHAYASEYDNSALSGQYCVQFVTFSREGGEVVRKFWQDRCIEWCYARTEEGKFGDQKYLDDWPQRFSEFVHVLINKELMLAPWNATRYPYGNSVLWHFHALRIISNPSEKLSVVNGDYFLPKCTLDNIYLPYLEDLRVIAESLAKNGIVYKSQKVIKSASFWRIVKNKIRKFIQ